MDAISLLEIRAVYTIDRQDGREPKVLKACAFLLWSGLHDLLNVYYPGWVTCQYEIPALGERGTIFNRRVGLVQSACVVHPRERAQ